MNATVISLGFGARTGSAGVVTLGFGMAPPAPPPPPPPAALLTPSGGGGLISPRYTSLTKTWDFPVVREIIEADDEMILKVIMDAVTKGRLH